MLIVGCGDVGQRIAHRLGSDGRDVECLVSSQESAMERQGQGLKAAALDLDEMVTGLPLNHDQIWYLVPPPASGTTDPRLQRFLAALPATAGRRRIVYIGTTGVYGDCNGEWVDETRPLNPQVDRARRRADAERQLAAWRSASHGEVIVLRVAGIYGPGKLPLQRLRQGTPMVAATDAPWTNRIHIDDLVETCLAAMIRGIDGEAYNVSDGTPGNMRDYFDRVADLFGLPRPPVVALDAADGVLSAGLRSYLGESRRLDNSKMLHDLGVRLRYPELSSGLAACLAAMEVE